MEEEGGPLGKPRTWPAEAGFVPPKGQKRKTASGEEILRHRKYIVIPVFVLYSAVLMNVFSGDSGKTVAGSSDST